MMALRAARLVGCRVHSLGEVESTQSELARLASEGAPEGTVVTAQHQRAGRGRRGHHWWDEPGASLLFSVLLRPTGPPSRVPQLSLVGGLAMAEALEGVAGLATRIRWPNDVLVDGRKICGILPEAASDTAGRLRHVLLGIGINLNQRDFPEDIRERATSLRLLTGRVHAADVLLPIVMEALDRRYAEWRAGGFAALREAWRQRATLAGQPVRLADGREATAVDVEDDGALLVRTDAGRLMRVVSGEPLGEGTAHAPRH